MKAKKHFKSFGDVWRHLDNVFRIARNITLEQVTLFSSMHDDEASIEQFHSAPAGLAAECEFGLLEPQLKCDLFFARVNAPGTST